jgi:predicted metal-dependent hydrolase
VCYGRVCASRTTILIVSFRNRWGSCSSEGRLNFHWRTILLPVPLAEYVVVHELVHLLEHQHSPAFWQRLERAMPDYDTRRQWLAERGSRFDL